MRISDWSSDVCSSDRRSSDLAIRAAASAAVGTDVIRSAGASVGAGRPNVTRAVMRFILWSYMVLSLLGVMGWGCARRREGAGRQVTSTRCGSGRSEEHTSELQSLMRISYAVFCLKQQKNKLTQ